MRAAVFALCCLAFAAGLHRLNESDHPYKRPPAQFVEEEKPPHHERDTLLPTLALSFNYTPALPDDASARRLTSFFKLAHSRVTPESDLRATAASLVPLYVQLCVSVPDCEEGVMELLAEHQSELRLAADRLDMLQLVLHRVRKIVHKGGGGRKKRPHHHHRGGLRRKGGRALVREA